MWECKAPRATWYGVQGRTSSTIPSVAGIQGINNGSTIAVRADGFGGPLFVGNNSGGVNAFIVDNSGNVSMTGSLTATNVSASVSSGDAADAVTSAGGPTAGNLPITPAAAAAAAILSPTTLAF